MLAEAWEAQQKYGGVSGRVTKKEIHNMGPAFSQFDATRGRQKVPPPPRLNSDSNASTDPTGKGQRVKPPDQVAQGGRERAEPSGGVRTVAPFSSDLCQRRLLLH
jgi:hypothetical protein